MYKILHKIKNIIIISVIAVCLFSVCASADGVNIVIDGRVKNFETAPIFENGRVMLPIRDTFESIGAKVDWNDETKEASAVKGDKTVTAKPGEDVIYINGEKLQMDVAALERDGRIFIPVRFAAEAFDCNVLWDNNSRTVAIYTITDFNLYKEAHAPVFTDIIPSAALENEEISKDSEKIYTYKTTYEDVTDYFMVLQEKFGFESYSVDFGENASTTHTYINQHFKEVFTLTCKNSDDGYTASVILKYEEENVEQPEIAQPKEETINPPTDEKADNGEYYENTNNTLPTYSSITGAPLIEKTTENDMDIYKYNDSTFGAMQYEMLIELSGYQLYNIDMNFGSITKYYSNNDTIVGITSDMFSNQVWIIIPHKN